VVFDSETWIKRADEVLSKGRSTNQTAQRSDSVCHFILDRVVRSAEHTTEGVLHRLRCHLKSKQQGMGNTAMDLSRHGPWGYY